MRIRKFKLKRTYRKERAAWVAYAGTLEAVSAEQSRRYDALLLDKSAWQTRALSVEKDFAIMEHRYRGNSG